MFQESGECIHRYVFVLETTASLADIAVRGGGKRMGVVAGEGRVGEKRGSLRQAGSKSRL